jgi:hypothetical protein
MRLNRFTSRLSKTPGVVSPSDGVPAYTNVIIFRLRPGGLLLDLVLDAVSGTEAARYRSRGAPAGLRPPRRRLPGSLGRRPP